MTLPPRSHASEKEDKEDELHKAADLARRRSDADGDDFDGLHGDLDAEQHGECAKGPCLIHCRSAKDVPSPQF